MKGETVVLSIDTFLLGITFLVFAVAQPGGLTGSNLDNFRVAIALDVASFILLLFSITCSSIYFWIMICLKRREKKAGTIISVFLIVMQVIAILTFFSALITMIITVIGFVQVSLGSTANDGDNLAIVAVSFLSWSAVAILAIAVVGMLFRFAAELDPFVK
jgi:hypothetical protein